MVRQIYPATHNFKDSIDFKNLSPEQKKHLKKVLKKEVKSDKGIINYYQKIVWRE